MHFKRGHISQKAVETLQEQPRFVRFQEHLCLTIEMESSIELSCETAEMSQCLTI